MRIRRLQKTIENTDKHVREFEYQTRSDSNGPVQFIPISRNMIVGTQASLTTKVRAVKEYSSAVSDGTFFLPRYEELEGTGKDVTAFTNSELISRVMAASDVELNYLSAIYPTTGAINGAISSSLRYGDLLLLVSAAEADKTLVMVRQVFIRFFTFLREMYKSIKHLSPTRAYAILSSTWLEARYGWRPLFLEMKGLYEAFIEDKNFEVRSTYGGDKFDNLFEQWQISLPVAVGERFYQLDHTVTVREISYKSGFNYFNKVDSRNNSEFAKFGLDLESLVQTAHELIPFSFILDMFVNIGDYLQTMNWRASVSPLNGYMTKRYVVDIETHSDFLDSGISATGSSWYIPELYKGEGFSILVNRYLAGVQSNTAYPYYFVDDNDVQHRVELQNLFHVGNIDNFNIPISPLVGPDGTLIDEDVHFNDIGGMTSPETSSLRLFPSYRHYTYENKSGDTVVWEGYVGVPVPSQVLVEALGPAHNISNSTSQQSSLFNARFDSDTGRYTPEKEPNGATISFGNSCRKRGILGGSGYIGREGPGSAGDDVFKSNGPVPSGIHYVGRPRDPHAIYLNPGRVASSFCSGEYVTREKHDEFDFELVAEIDLNGSQTIDLLIFGERLLTALRGK